MTTPTPSPSPSTPNATDPQPTPPPTTPPTLFAPRSLKQFTLFLAGASFFTLSTLITRRALLRRRLATFPSFYHPSNAPPRLPVNGPLEAVEALSLATVNVSSFMMMMAGGGLWAWDISTLEDLRRKVRGRLGIEAGEGREQVAEEEFEEWLAGVLERKERKGREGREG